MLSEQKATKFISYHSIDGTLYEYRVYFVLRTDNTSSVASPVNKKRISLQRRPTIERQISNISSFLEDNLDYDYIYLEVTDKEDQFYSTIINQRTLSAMLSKDKEN